MNILTTALNALADTTPPGIPGFGSTSELKRGTVPRVPRFLPGSEGESAELEAERQGFTLELIFPVARARQKLQPLEGLIHGGVTAQFILEWSGAETLVKADELAAFNSSEKELTTLRKEMEKFAVTNTNARAWVEAHNTANVFRPGFREADINDAHAALIAASRKLRDQEKAIIERLIPIYEAIGNRLDALLEAEIAKQLSADISEAKRFNIPFAPKVLLITLWKARFELPAQREGFRGQSPHHVLWGIVGELLKRASK